MDLVTVLTLIGTAVLVSVVITTVVVRALSSNALAGAKSRIASLEQQITQTVGDRDRERERAEELGRQVIELRSAGAVDKERLSWLQTAERSLRETFEAIASQTLRRTTNVLTQQNKEQLEGVISPLNTELKRLDRYVHALEEKREGAYQSVVEQVRLISEQYRNLQTATTSLDQALRAPNVRGRWGEVQLRRLVEMAGLTEHVDFEEQRSSGGRRPDLIVHLPSEAIIPVDAKAPMKAYLESVEAASPELAQEAAKRHAKAMRGHIQGLADKAYWSGFDRAPEFVVMLVPYESGLAAAFSQDPNLLEYALEHKVVVAAPASFLALLRVVAYGWMQVELSRNAESIAASGKDLLDRLGPFADHLNRLGSALNATVERFNDAAGSYEHRVLPGARRLQELGASTTVPSSVSEVDATTRRVRNERDRSE